MVLAGIGSPLLPARISVSMLRVRHRACPCVCKDGLKVVAVVCCVVLNAHAQVGALLLAMPLASAASMVCMRRCCTVRLRLLEASPKARVTLTHGPNVYEATNGVTEDGEDGAWNMRRAESATRVRPNVYQRLERDGRLAGDGERRVAIPT